MHNNYYFLRQVAAELGEILRGFTVVSCFSQNKDELILEFNDSHQSFFIKASFEADFQCLSFPATFHRARKNSIDLFGELILQPVSGIRMYTNERSFGLLIGGNFQLIFKMHGRQGNVILTRDNEVCAVFRHNFPADLTLQPAQLDRSIDWSFEHFIQHQHSIRSQYMTFGASVWEYLEQQGYSSKPAHDQFVLIVEVRKKLEHPSYTIIERAGTIQLTLLPTGPAIRQFNKAIEAATEFFFLHQSHQALAREKTALLATVRGRLKQNRTFLEKNHRRLAELEADHHYQYWADLIMANLHRIPAGSSSVALEDFHEPGKQITVKLKKELNPQRNAEVFYRKAKNQSIERNTLLATIARKEEELATFMAQETAILQASDRETLRPFREHFTAQGKEKARRETMPYHEHQHNGFRILVGKSAAANDELTLHHTHKDDLWLHAKDVPGSHVVIKYQAGKTFPKEVVEFAASLAAFHSKRKNDSLCPVAITPAKYVRKRKGDPPGTVMLQREDVLLVVPGSGKESKN